MPVRTFAVGVAVVSAATALGIAQAPAPAAPPDFGRDVMPILETNCLRCHNTAKLEGGLLLESFDDLMEGGDDGSPIVPGDADGSALIRQVEGRAKPKMPPKSDLRPEDIATLRAWVAAGAAYTPTRRVPLDEKVPAIAQTASLLAEVSSVAFSPDGRELVAAGYKEVKRFALSGSASITSGGRGALAPRRQTAISGLADQVRAVAWSPDGQLIAAGGGTPGAFGELVLIDAATREVKFTLEGHRDYVYHVAFSPDGKRLASCGYDKLVRLWDTTTGKPTGVFREHTEAVYAVAFNGDGTLLASAAADRSIKIWDVKTGLRLYTITDPTDAVLTLAFRPGTSELAAAGADKRLRVWTIDKTAATPIRNVLAHTATIIRLAFSTDGAAIATASTDRAVKLWDAASGKEIRALGAQSDWVQALAFSPDRRRLAVGRYDGTLSLFDSSTGKRTAELIARPQMADSQKASQD
jgi:WD40 repeat protein/mono/diheme cytochrome c family protein